MLLNTFAFGLDIEDRSVKLAHLKKYRTFLGDTKFLLTTCGRIAVPEGYIINGEIRERKKLAEILKQLIQKANIGRLSTRGVAACLPESKTFLKLMEIPIPPSRNTKTEPPNFKKPPHEKNEQTIKIKQLIREEARRHIPLPLEELYLDWQILPALPGGKYTKVLLGAALKTIVDSYTEFLEESGLFLFALETESAAIARAIISPEEELDPSPRAIIDLGATRTSILIWRGGGIEFTISLPISGNKITQTIAQSLGISFAEAEKTKIQCGLDIKKCQTPLVPVLKAILNDMMRNLEKALEHFKKSLPLGHQKIRNILLCGGGANMLKLDSLLALKLKTKISKSHPLKDIILSPKLHLDPNEAQIYATAIGLARRAIKEAELK